MWSNVISLDKGQNLEFKFIENEVSKISALSTAIEESPNRKYLYLAGLCDYADEIRVKLENIIVEYFLTYYKSEYFIKVLNLTEVNHALATLVSTMVCIDREFERAFVVKELSKLSSYDLDGIFHFRLRPLRNSWLEMAQMCKELFAIGADDTDIFNVVSYISATGNTREVILSLTYDNEFKLKNLKTNSIVPILKVYDNEEFDVLHAILANKATKIVLDEQILSKPMLKALHRIIKVKKGL